MRAIWEESRGCSWRREISIAVANIAAMLGFGSKDNTLMQALEDSGTERDVKKEPDVEMGNTPSDKTSEDIRGS